MRQEATPPILSRREVVGGLVGLAALGSRRWWASALPALSAPGRVSLEGPLGKAVFAALLGEPFTVSSATHAARVTLARIDDGRVSPGTEQFSLVLRGAPGPGLPEGLYTLAHRTAGRTTLFLQPAGHDGAGRHYAAPFNLLA